MIWTGHTGLVTETGKMVSRELLLSNLPAMPPEIRFIPIRKTKREKKINVSTSSFVKGSPRKVRRKEYLDF